MSFRAEIVRGIRLAAILFTFVLCWIAGRRMFDLGPSQARPSASATPSRRSIASVPPSREDRSPAQASAAEVRPPQIHRMVRRREPIPKPARVASILQTGPVAIKGQLVAASPEPKPVEELAVETNTAPPATTDATHQSDAEAHAAASQSSDPDSGSRPKRWVRAVGRVFHIGSKKDVTSEAVRQP
jgi:hypothetical protein